ncbi:hypothetical protein ACHWQZ_G018772 [Mnemiopsis leidyi]
METLLLLVLGLAILSIRSVTVDKSTCANSKPKCWYILNSPSGTTNFNININPDNVVTGVITVNGMINQNPLALYKTESDFLKLLKFQNSSGYSDVIMQLKLQVGRQLQHTVDVRGILVETGPEKMPQLVDYPAVNARDIEYVVDPEAERNGNFWIFRDGRIRIQISDMEASRLHAYKLFFGDPGKAVQYQFNYGSEENWQQFKHLRLNATRVVSNEDEKLVALYNNITVCPDATPVMCGSDNEIVRVGNLGETVTLKCSGFGSPYLVSRWENKNGIELGGFLEEVSYRGADSFIHTSFVIKRFNVDDVGNYFCFIRNYNFNTTAQKLFSLEYSKKIFVVRSPRDMLSADIDVIKLQWIIDGWPLSNVRLNCQNMSENSYNVTKNLYPDYSSVPRLHLIFSAKASLTPDQFKCAVFDNNFLLEEMTFYSRNVTETKNSLGISHLVNLVIGIACGVAVCATIYLLIRSVHCRISNCFDRREGELLQEVLPKEVDETPYSEQVQTTSLNGEDSAVAAVSKVPPSSLSEVADECSVPNTSMGSNISSSIDNKTSLTTKMDKNDGDYSWLRVAVQAIRKRRNTSRRSTLEESEPFLKGPSKQMERHLQSPDPL